jgi:hypothetical protein
MALATAFKMELIRYGLHGFEAKVVLMRYMFEIVVGSVVAMGA